jgi:hypothetical protein
MGGLQPAGVVRGNCKLFSVFTLLGSAHLVRGVVLAGREDGAGRPVDERRVSAHHLLVRASAELR